MKSAPYVFALILIGLVLYLGFHHFEIPTFFLFGKTEKTKGVISHTELTFGVKGHLIQRATYEYRVNGKLFTDTFKAGRREGLQTVGDSIQIKYLVGNPEKNEVVGFYRNTPKPFI
jgi:hypothetical protein